ncbi:hypothetical protein Hanom_Chr02g00110061 [Helianthus anomalus]
MIEASSHCCCFKDGWLKLVEEVPMANEPYLVFTMIDLKTFELSVFDLESGTEMDKGKCEIDTDEVLVTKNENPVHHLFIRIII